jgi:hypothetical protein
MIRSSNIFWGGVLIVLGALFLVDTLGIIEINLWSIFWPLLLIVCGVWVLVGYFRRADPVGGEEASIPLDNARSAKIHLRHGAGRLTVGTGAGPMDLISGTFGGGLNFKTRGDGDGLDVTMRVRDSGFPVVMFPWLWGPQHNFEWDVKFTDEIPLELKLNTGASDARLDLTDLQITNLRVDTGASATEITLPDSVEFTKVVIKAGAASVNVNVPEGVAARIRVSGGLMGANVDRNRFPKSGGYYQSPDYETASHKAEIRVEGGVGSVTVR